MRVIFETFSKLLEERFRAGVLTTEDSVRYTFLLALISSRYCGHTDVVLEYPHPTIRGARVDTLITESANRRAAALEFK
jgi:hypothetical protein